MKIRSGFVSNSSSSSYIVSIDISPEKFYELVYNEYSGWYIDELAEEIAKCIAVNKNGVVMRKRQQTKYNTENCDALREATLINFLKSFETEITRLEAIYNAVIADGDAKFVISALLNYARISMKQEENKITLVGDTTMHNYFQDMPKILDEIMSFFLFDTNYTVKCYREGQYGEVIKDES